MSGKSFIWNIFNNYVISRDLKQKNFQYPSITVCPEKTFKNYKKLPESGKFKDVRQFYLDNVRSIDEVFFFVNQRTWSRDGHKCMTGKVSEDPGRPCIFPFTVRPLNLTNTKCRMPPTWVSHHFCQARDWNGMNWKWIYVDNLTFKSVWI